VEWRRCRWLSAGMTTIGVDDHFPSRR